MVNLPLLLPGYNSAHVFSVTTVITVIIITSSRMNMKPTLALLMVQCSALFSWSYSKLNSKVPNVAAKTGKEERN